MKVSPNEEAHADLHEEKWMMQYFELKKFKEEYGHCDVSNNRDENYRYYTLARWCDTQRVKRKHNPLKYSPDRLNKLNELGFSWSIKDKWFESRFRQLKQYYEKNGHCDVPLTHKNKQYRVLATWCGTQRREKKFNPLKYPPDRVNRLNELGFSWDMHDKWFENKFQQLKLYHKKYGHCNVSVAENEKLAGWCVKVKRARIKKVSTLTEGMIARLDELGFPWHNRRKERNELLWEQRFAQLKEYHKEHGDCDVPKTHDKKNKYYILGAWCAVQRLERKRNPQKYSADRLKKLNELGFCWDSRDKKFENIFRQLKQYHEKYGHCDVTGNHDKKTKYYTLGRWCATQRRERNLQPLKYSPDRLKKLNELGFSWSLLDNRFEDRFLQLKQYLKEHGHCNVSIIENKLLAQWCFNLRRAYKKKTSTLTKEMITRLTDIGFIWSPSTGQISELLWERQFTSLKEYKNKYGHCNVSRSTRDIEYQRTAYWVKMQRLEYRNKSKNLTAERIAKLNSIGFDWINPIKSPYFKKINDVDLLNELRRLYSIRGIPPSADFIDKYGKYSAHAYDSHFGNITEARKAAGIISGISKPYKYSDDELLNDLRQAAVLLGRTPVFSDMKKYVKYSPELYHNRFGGIFKARKAAGISSDIFMPKKYSGDELLDDLRRLAALYNRIPTSGDVKKYGKYPIVTYDRYFDGLPRARIAAGLSSTKIKVMPKKYSDAELLNELKRLAALLDRTPTASDIIKHGKYSAGIYFRRFGSLIEALKKARIDRQ